MGQVGRRHAKLPGGGIEDTPAKAVSRRGRRRQLCQENRDEELLMFPGRGSHGARPGTQWGKLRQGDFFGLQTFRPLLHDKRHSGAFVERPVAACRNRGKVDEHVLTILALDKAESFAGVEPLHCTCFFHVSLSND